MRENIFHIIVNRYNIALDGVQEPYPLEEVFEERDRLIAEILDKVLNLRLSASDSTAFGKKEFEALGKTLFKLLFSNRQLYEKFQDFYNNSGNRDEKHQFILEFSPDADEMAALPWEYLFFEEKGTFIAAPINQRVNLVRRLPFKGSWLNDSIEKNLYIEPPLRVLVVIANPDDQEWHLDDKEIAAIKQYFTNIPDKEVEGEAPEQEVAAHPIEIDFIEQPERETFSQVLSKKFKEFKPHILHFIGHGRIDEASRSGQLCLLQKTAEKTYKPDWVDDDIIANWIQMQDQLMPYMVFLHVCDGTRIGSYKEKKGVAIKIIEKGVPFVLTMQNPINEPIAAVFVKKIYNALARGVDIGTATNQARSYMATYYLDKIRNESYKVGHYGHKMFGSLVLFTSVRRMFMLGILPEVEKQERQAETTTTDTTTSSRGASAITRTAASTEVEDTNQRLAEMRIRQDQKSLKIIYEKRGFLQEELIKVSDSAQKFTLTTQIDELNELAKPLEEALGIRSSTNNSASSDQGIGRADNTR